MFWVVLTVTIDQITKHLASAFLQAQFIPVLDFFILTYATNRGIAFGLFAGVKEIVVYLSLAIVVAISLIPGFVKLRKSTEIFLSLIVGGALGNLIDRIRFGYVIDFLTMKHWPTVFNMADIFIFFGSLFLLVQLLSAEIKLANRKHKAYRREISGGYTGYLQRKWLATGQVFDGENTKLGLKNVHTESNKECGSIGQWNFEEAELQGEVWGYNYIERSGKTTTPGNSTGEYTS